MITPWQESILLVIPSINGGQLLARMLPTLQFTPSSIVVLDQGSTDDTTTVCAQAGVEMLQLGEPRTYTQACNIGAHLARERSRQYLCVANNDIVFRTDVMRAMHAAMELDSRLGIVAPGQIVHDDASDTHPMASRVFWDLAEVWFMHDLEAPDRRVQRLEADFCELTCALVRISAIEEIGFLDDDYGFYYEDADFGFRLRKGGYTCAYLPHAQIVHFASSTVSKEKAFPKKEYIDKNRRNFVRKHLGFAVGADLPSKDSYRERAMINQGIQSCLYRYGLVACGAPELAISYATIPSSGAYLYTSLEPGPSLPRWIAAHRSVGAIFTIFTRTNDLLVSHGMERSFYVPLGIDPDTFHPWGHPCRLHEQATTYLAILHGEQYQLRREILSSWIRFAPGKAARLVLYGPGLGGCMGRAPDATLRVGNVELSRYDAESIEVHDVLWPRRGRDLADLYRSVDYTIVDTAGDDAALATLQSAACGVPCLAANLRGTTDFPAKAAVVTSHFANGSAGPEDRLLTQLRATLHCSAAERDGLAQAGMNAVRGGFTVRDTAMGFYRALSLLQIRRPSAVLQMLDQLPRSDVSEEPVVAPGRFGAKVGRRIRTLGRVTESFGTAWHDNGLHDATRTIRSELAYFATHRSSQFSRATGAVVRQFRLRTAASRATPIPNSALLIGYIDAQLGLGQSLRGLAFALSRTDVAFGIYPLSRGVEGRRSSSYMAERYDQSAVRAVNVIEVATTELPDVLAEVGEAHFTHSYNVLRTYWELAKAPEKWRELLNGIDELWVPNEFVGSSFRGIFDRTITIIPPCVHPTMPAKTAERPFGLTAGVFYFLFSFDYFSFLQRKNPLAVIRAFRRAFPVTPRVGLVIKSTASTEHFSEVRHALRIAAQADDRIRLIDEELNRDEMLLLLATADCYVSLHRSEGFGLGMAESMALGKPVIGTDYSGSTDFLREDTGYPVPCTLIPVRPDDYIYTDNQVWAEPDETACVAAMIRVVNNPAEVVAKTAAARRFVTARYGPDAVGRLVAERLAKIFAQRASSA